MTTESTARGADIRATAPEAVLRAVTSGRPIDGAAPGPVPG